MLTVPKIFLFELVCSRSYVRQVHAPLAKFTSGSDYLGLSRDSGTFDLGLNSHEPFEIQTVNLQMYFQPKNDMSTTNSGC